MQSLMYVQVPRGKCKSVTSASALSILKIVGGG